MEAKECGLPLVFKSVRVHTHISLTPATALAIEEKEKKKNERDRKQVKKEIYTCIRWDPVTRNKKKKRIFVDINYFLPLLGFEQQ